MLLGPSIRMIATPVSVISTGLKYSKGLEDDKERVKELDVRRELRREVRRVERSIIWMKSLG